jgi:protein-disulfide isomerase
VSRRDRRAAQRAGNRRLAAAATRQPDGLASTLRSPMALITILVALVVAAGFGFVLIQGSSAASGPLTVPPALPSGIVAHDRSIGSTAAPVRLDEWEDLQCPFCDQYTLTVEPTLIEKYVATGQVEITYHDFAFIGPASDSGAVAARCAGAQGQFWPYMEYLFYNQGPENGGTFNQALFDRIGTALGLDLPTFDKCLSDPAQASAVQAETNQGNQLGIQSTPAFFINGQKYTGSADLASLESAVDAALKSAPTAPPAAPSPAATSTP